MKYLVVALYCMRHRAFDEHMNGLVYGATASLGFATLENVLYVADGGLTVAIGRAFTVVPVHAALGLPMGYYLGKARQGRPLRNYLLAWVIPVALHTAYDFPLLSASHLDACGYTATPGLSLMLFLGFLLPFIVLSHAANRKLKHVRERQPQRNKEAFGSE